MELSSARSTHSDSAVPQIDVYYQEPSGENVQHAVAMEPQTTLTVSEAFEWLGRQPGVTAPVT